MTERKMEVVDVQKFGIELRVIEGYSAYHPVDIKLSVNYPSLNFTVDLPAEALLRAVENVKVQPKKEE